MFLLEAILLSAIGGFFGLTAGLAIVGFIDVAIPALPVSYSPLFIGLAEGISMTIGLIAGILPAVRAAQLVPVDALRAE
jgi:putative ABC transport system permease protein